MKVTELENLSSKGIANLTRMMLANVELFLEVIEPSWNSLKIPPTHSEIYAGHDLLTKQEKSEMYLICFRGYAKSSIKRNVTLRDICFGIEKLIVFCNETERQSMADLDAVMNEIRFNLQIKFLFGDLTKAHDKNGKIVDNWAAKRCRFYREDNPSFFTEVMAIGIGAKVRGFHAGGMRINKLWLDDYESEDNTRTADMRENLSIRINSKLMPARDAKRFSCIYSGTIVHPKSHLALTKSNVANQINCSATSENSLYFERDMSTCSETFGIGTWPELHGYKTWKSVRQNHIDAGTYWQFLQEYYNVPRQSSDPSFKTDMITGVDYTFNKYKNLTWLESISGKKVICKTFLGMDPAYSFAKKSDSTAIIVGAVTPTGSYIVLEIVYDKIGQTDKINHLRRLNDKYALSVVNIESYGAALELPQFLEEDNRRKNIRMNIEIFNEKIGKSKKYLNSLEGIINAGKLHYLHGVSHIETMIEQMSTFSGEERYHDDLIDGIFLMYEKSEIPYDVNVDVKLKSLIKRSKSNEINAAMNPFKRMAELHEKLQRRKR